MKGEGGLMKARLVCVLLFCSGLWSQIPAPFPAGSVITSPPSVFEINSGGPAVPGDTSDPNNAIPPYIADTFFSNGDPFVDTTMGPGRWASLRYGPSFNYDIPLPNGIYTIRFDLLEPNQNGVGLRVFTITMNGSQSGPIDIFQLAGGIKKQTSLYFMPVVSTGVLHILFQASVGNAVVSAIEVGPAFIYSGIEAHFIRFYPCDQSYPQTTCIQINPGNQPQFPFLPPAPAAVK
jgi:hypothetical protein